MMGTRQKLSGYSTLKRIAGYLCRNEKRTQVRRRRREQLDPEAEALLRDLKVRAQKYREIFRNH